MIVKFSILINVHNGEKFIVDTLNSVLNQTLQDFELLIYDNASTDRTVGKIQDFHDSRIKLFIGKNKVSLPLARQNLLDRATGEFCLFLDADDLWLPHLLETFDSDLAKQETKTFIYSNFCVMDREERSLLIKNSTSRQRVVPKGRLLSCYNVGFFCFCFSRELILESGIRFDSDVNAGCDYAFVLEINSQYSGIELPGLLGINRWHRHNLSQCDPARNLRELAGWHFKNSVNSPLNIKLQHFVEGSRFDLAAFVISLRRGPIRRLSSVRSLAFIPVIILIKVVKRFLFRLAQVKSIIKNISNYYSFYRIFYLQIDDEPLLWKENETQYSSIKVSDTDDRLFAKLIYVTLIHDVFNPTDFCGDNSFVTYRCDGEGNIVGASFFLLKLRKQFWWYLKAFHAIPKFEMRECALFSSSCSVRGIAGVSDAIERFQLEVAIAKAEGKRFAVTVSNVDVRNSDAYFRRLGFKAVEPRAGKRFWLI